MGRVTAIKREEWERQEGGREGCGQAGKEIGWERDRQGREKVGTGKVGREMERLRGKGEG